MSDHPSVHDLMQPQTPPPKAVVVNDKSPRAFTSAQVVVATLLGSPLAGGIVLAINARRLGRNVGVPVLVGLGMTAALIAAGMVLGEHFAGALPVAGVLGMRGYAQQQQLKLGPTVRASWFAPLGIGIAGLALFGGMFIASLKLGVPSNRIDMGGGQELRYEDGVSAADAHALGDALRDIGYFDGAHPATVVLERDGKTWAISFVLADGFWDKPGVDAMFFELRKQIEQHTGWVQFEIRLCNDELTTERTL